MNDYDIILIAQSDVVEYDTYSKFPVDRLELFETMVYPRMVRYKDKFRSHLDILNDAKHGKFYSDSGYPDRRDLLNIWNLPSASGVHLANFLLTSGIRTRIINNIDSEWDIFEEVYTSCSTPPLVGISSTFYLSWTQIKPVARRLRDLDADMDIVLGGAFSNAASTHDGNDAFEKMMRRMEIKYVLHAFNSEEDLRDLILTLKSGGDIDTVKNLCYLDGRGESATFHVTPTLWNQPVLADAPAHYDKLEMPFLNRTIQIRTASGCPFSCSFCSYPVTAGAWKTLEADRIRAHLDSIERIGGIDKIIFIDDTFNVPKERFKTLLRVFSEYDFEWFSFLRVQFADEEVVSMMKDSGCKGVYLGIESANDTVLQNMNKRATRDDFCRGLERLNRHGILSLAAFVIGFPGETDKTIRDNIEFIENYGVDYYSLKEFFYIPGTKIHTERQLYGLSGTGAKWQHDTMDSDEASKIKIDMFRSIKNSTHIDPDTSLWYFAYLYDQGYDIPTIEKAQKQINSIMMQQLGGNFSDDLPAYDTLRQIVRDREIIPA
jgi:anaerobic magnesium-protoporphyrin IX monomethyl ester cyclase